MKFSSCAISNDLSGLKIAGLEECSGFLDPVVKYLGCASRLGNEEVPPSIGWRIAGLEPYQVEGILTTNQPKFGLPNSAVLDGWTMGLARVAQIRGVQESVSGNPPPRSILANVMKNYVRADDPKLSFCEGFSPPRSLKNLVQRSLSEI